MEHQKKRRVAIYARVSTASQTVENQLIRLREVAARANWDVVREYTETASGASNTRSVFDRMMDDARRRRFDVIAVVDVSRLGRTLRGLVTVFDDLRQIGCDIFIDREAVDTTTSAGRMVFGMFSVIAAFERDLIIERTVDGMRRARAQGKQIGRPPAGEAVKTEVRALRAAGFSMDKIAHQLGVGKSVSQRFCQEFDREMKEAIGAQVN